MSFKKDIELIAKEEADKIRARKKKLEWETEMALVRMKAQERDGIMLQDGSYLD